MKHLKQQPKQHLTEVWSGTEQTVVDEATDEWRRRSGLVSLQRGDILNIYCNIGCSESSANIFMLSGCQEGVFYCPDTASSLYYKGSASLNGTIKFSACA